MLVVNREDCATQLMPMDEVQKKLEEIDEARAKLHAKVSETLDELNKIDDALDDAKSRQAERMRADSRVDDSIIEQVQGEEGEE